MQPGDVLVSARPGFRCGLSLHLARGPPRTPPRQIELREGGQRLVLPALRGCGGGEDDEDAALITRGSWLPKPLNGNRRRAPPREVAASSNPSRLGRAIARSTCTTPRSARSSTRRGPEVRWTFRCPRTSPRLCSANRPGQISPTSSAPSRRTWWARCSRRRRPSGPRRGWSA